MSSTVSAALKAAREALETAKAEFAEAKAAIEAEKAEARAAAFAERADKLVQEGKLTPANKEAVLAFAKSLSVDTQVEFAEGDAKPQAEAFFALLESAKPGPDFSEHSGENGDPAPAALTDQDIANQAIAYRAEQKAKGINVSFTEAVKQVTK